MLFKKTDFGTGSWANPGISSEVGPQMPFVYGTGLLLPPKFLELKGLVFGRCRTGITPALGPLGETR